jgi:redox-sensitive bicupin YhaK (pirin superfamily)
MISLRKSEDRGHANHGWLDSHHTFSFGEYHDPAHMGFASLRVINDDRVAAGAGFPTHPHRNMEIVTYMLEGALAHRDSMGNGSVIRTGDVQRMTAGTGVSHSEFNSSDTDPVHFLQIWILPDQTGRAPEYEQKHFPAAEKRGQLRLVASPDGRDGSVSLHQDAFLFATLLESGEQVSHAFGAGRCGYLQVAKGTIKIGDLLLGPGDGAAFAGEPEVVLRGIASAEVLLFDLQET